MNFPAIRMISQACVALLATAALLGCRPHAAEPAELLTGAAGEVVGPEYSASKGLHVPEATRASLGIELSDATEQPLSREIPLSLRIYQVDGGIARGTSMLAPADAALLRAGHPITARVDGTTASGTIVALDGELTRVNGTVEALVELHAGPGLAPGAFVTAAATVPERKGMTVPAAAVVRASDGDFVYTISGDHYVRTPVKVGMVTDDRAEIVDGLYAGDQVVSRAAMSLWMTELAAVKGGHACCVIPPKGK